MAKAYKKQIQDLTFNRGDERELNWTLPGNISTEKVYFTVKPDRVLSSSRYVEKKNTLAGGSDTEILVTSDGSKSSVTVFMLEADTYDLSDLSLVYDLWVEAITPSFTSATYVDGDFTLLADVRTPFDGFAVPSTATRFLQLDADDFTSGSLFQVSTDGGGDNTFIELTVNNLVTQLGLIDDTVRRVYGLKQGTLASPPSGLSANELWEDTTDSSTAPILRIHKI